MPPPPRRTKLYRIRDQAGRAAGKQCSERLEAVFEGGGGSARHAGHGGDVLNRGLADAIDGAEALQQRFFALGADARDLVERGLQRALAACGTVVGDCEAVRFVADALEKEQAGAVTREDDWV